MKLILIMFLSVLSFHCKAQLDTLYVFFENNGLNNRYPVYKHRDDPEPRKEFPFDGAWHYRTPKKVGEFEKNIAFTFNSYTPEWMDKQFDYEKVDKSILQEKDFKDRDWFDQISFGDII